MIEDTNSIYYLDGKMKTSLPRTRILSVGKVNSETIKEVELVFALPISDRFDPACVRRIVQFHQQQMNLPRMVMRYLSENGPIINYETGFY